METKETKLTATQLARPLSDVLNRVQYKGERFVIERNGQVEATLEPAVVQPKTATVRDFVEFINSRPSPDEDFAGDLEAVHREQPPAQVREWPD